MSTWPGWLRALLRPACWMQIHPYSAQWDRMLQHLLEHYEFTDINEHTAQLGPIEVWIHEAYYGMHPWWPNIRVRASLATILDAYDKLEKTPKENALDTLEKRIFG